MKTLLNPPLSGRAQFERQVALLSDAGLLDRTSATLSRLAELAERLPQPTPGHLSLVLVARGIAPELAMRQVEVRGQAGVVNMTPVPPASFQPRPELGIPAQAYLLVDVDPGRAWLNVPPSQALPQFQAAGRSPLTVEEGVALVLAYPEVLGDKKSYCAFSMAGSRRDDQRVPALWISYKQPRLGWCWDNAPHTWMGTASCAGRLS
jgi:hypothetical protein